MSAPTITVQSLNRDTLCKTAQSLIALTKMPFREYPETAIDDGLVFALELQAVRLGLASEDALAVYDGDSARMMDAFADAIHQHATAANLNGWPQIADSLPYGTFDKVVGWYERPFHRDTLKEPALSVSDLPQEILAKTVADLVFFTEEFTYFDERGVTAGTGLSFALGFQVIELGLVNDPAQFPMVMHAFVDALTQCATDTGQHGWADIASTLTYGRQAIHPDDTRLSVEELSDAALLHSAKTLVLFMGLLGATQNDTAPRPGLAFAIKTQAIHNKLINFALLDDPNFDAFALLNAFADAMHRCASESNLKGWEKVCKCLPYGSE